MQRQPSDTTSTASAETFLRDTQALFLPPTPPAQSPTPNPTIADTLESQLEYAFSGFKVSLAEYLLQQKLDGKTARETFTARARLFHSTGSQASFIHPVSVYGAPPRLTASIGRRVRSPRSRISREEEAREVKALVSLSYARAKYIAKQQQRAHAALMRETRVLLSLGLL
ncbi:hypothetical protein BCR33DRAFT_720406 [Rhizoclosmatium globosum]|uniref:Uncharacterized protein n=1 Tax=Rhizoclosmatium globosum TaxID=329046 RepID=A0A1Y2BWN3_9FUNG|nr:hypothetical protein BCR33DRAFT_720406 [Rhizoclosmatium globosum]|eukprot:ORY39172.1 hypothetical protein BCR33DRAFT_720406 [Rhizoclosmatium globosum]